MPILPTDFDFIRKMVYERSAIVLDQGKEYLVEARLHPLAQREGLASIQEMVAQMKADKYNGLYNKVVEAMTTNETSFFRDIHPFETLKKEILPIVIKNRGATRKLNIWCGASSSGQEPYTIAMVLRENFPQLLTWQVTFISSDISQEMLTRCRTGKYSQLEVNRGLPAPLLVKYFSREGIDWQIKPDLRKMVDYREINLSSNWPVMPPMDIIFMRNVLIYFDIETKRGILKKIHSLMQPDGFLFLGAAETTLNLDERFERLQYAQSGCYRIKPPVKP